MMTDLETLMVRLTDIAHAFAVDHKDRTKVVLAGEERTLVPRDVREMCRIDISEGPKPFTLFFGDEVTIDESELSSLVDQLGRQYRK